MTEVNEEIECNDGAERRLWCAVILQAFEDATAPVMENSYRRTECERDRWNARDWLLKPNRDFDHACHLAGLDPIAVRERSTARINEFDRENEIPARGARNIDRPIVKTKRQDARFCGGHWTQTFTYDGRTLSAKEWAKVTGIDIHTLRLRLRKGWSIEKAITEKIRKINQRFTYDGRTLTVTEWARVTGIKATTLWSRLYLGWTIEQAIRGIRCDANQSPLPGVVEDFQESRVTGVLSTAQHFCQIEETEETT